MKNVFEMLEKLGAVAAEKGRLLQKEATLWAELGHVLCHPPQLEAATAKQIEPLPSSDTNPNEMLATKEAATALGLAPNTLVQWRSTGGGPKYAKIGRRVLYRRMDIDQFIVSNLR